MTVSSEKSRRRAEPPVDYDAIWNSIPTPCVVLDPDNRFSAANAAAELYFSQSVASLTRKSLTDYCGEASRLSELVSEVRRDGASRAEYGVELMIRDREPAQVDLQAAPLMEQGGRRAAVCCS